MFKKITSGLFILLLLVEIICRQTGYVISNSFLNFLSRTYLVFFVITLVVLCFNKLPRQLAIGMTIIGTVSLIILSVLTFPVLIMSTSGHSVTTKKFSSNNFRIESVRGQDWAGPNYDNYILYKTKVLGLLKKEIALAPVGLVTDTCLVKFVQYDNGDSIVYYYNDCEKDLNVEK